MPLFHACPLSAEVARARVFSLCIYVYTQNVHMRGTHPSPGMILAIDPREREPHVPDRACPAREPKFYAGNLRCVRAGCRWREMPHSGSGADSGMELSWGWTFVAAYDTRTPFAARQCDLRTHSRAGVCGEREETCA